MHTATIYDIVTTRILAQLEEGISPWVKPWATNPALAWPTNPTTEKRYRGFNAMWLNCETERLGYGTNLWLTFKQAQEAGGTVRKGEKSTPAIRPIEIRRSFNNAAENEGCTDDPGKILLFRGFSLFNLDQCDGLDRFRPAPTIAINPVERRADVDEAIARTRAEIRHGGERCYYSPFLDYIQMVEPERFEDTRHYYGTALHELTHWTGCASRLARIEVGKPMDRPAYAFEELVAEMGAAFTCQALGIDGIDRHQAAYLSGWMEIIRADDKTLLRAAGAAQKAYDLILPS